MSQTESSYDFDYESRVQHHQQTFEEGFSEHYNQGQHQDHSSYYHEEHSQYPEEHPSSQSSISLMQPPISFLQSTFEQLDKDGRGVITKSVLKRATMVTAHHYDRRIIREEIDKCDNQINYSRFVEIFDRANVGNGGVNQWLFSLYDKDAKGFIAAEDLLRVAQITGIELSGEQVEQMVVTERNRGSGRVDYEDFRYIMEEEVQYM